MGDGHGRHELPVLVALRVGGGAPGVEVAVGGVGEDGIGAGRPDPPVPAVGQPVVGDVGQGPGADGGQFGQARGGAVGWRGGAGGVVRVDNVHLPVAGKKDRGDGDEPTLQNCLHYGLQRPVVQQIFDLTRRSHSERAVQPTGSGMQTRLHTPL